MKPPGAFPAQFRGAKPPSTNPCDTNADHTWSVSLHDKLHMRQSTATPQGQEVPPRRGAAALSSRVMTAHTPSDSPSGPRTVFCVKFQRELPGLEAPPWPGELGQRVYNNVSAEAWRQWEERMKMILQRVPPHAVAERGAGNRHEADGRILLRRGCGSTATGIRPRANEVAAHRPRRKVPAFPAKVPGHRWHML